MLQPLDILENGKKRLFNQESRSLLQCTFTTSWSSFTYNLQYRQHIWVETARYTTQVPATYASYASNKVISPLCTDGTIVYPGWPKSPIRKETPSLCKQNHLIILTQPTKTRQITRTIKIPIPRLRRQNPIPHPRLPIPLRRALRRPRPIKPPPRRLITAHLRLRIGHEPFFVGVGVGGWVGVGEGAGTGGGFGGAGGSEDGGGAVGRLEGAFPAGAGGDVVEVGGAVGVGLGPFAAEGGAEAVGGRSVSYME